MVQDSVGLNYTNTVSPGEVMHPGLDITKATYVDVNPNFDVATSPAHLLVDTYAILYGSIANILVTPFGGRSRIFQEDYWCGLQYYLQEPYDALTATSLSLSINNAISKWEPRLVDTNVQVTTDDSLPGYVISVVGSMLNNPGNKFSASYAVPLSGQ